MGSVNLEQSEGYGSDGYTLEAKEKIKKACSAPDAAIYFLIGGTQTNAVAISSLLRPYEGCICCDTAHINTHEAGAIELSGHKVIALPNEEGKVSAAALSRYLEDWHKDGNRDHIVHPGMVYISQPTEYGTLYSLSEITEIRKICDQYGLCLYLDGARLAYALASGENDVSLEDLAHLCHVFYIGGTKCGALLGEALVVPGRDTLPHFFPRLKQCGAVLAKGRLLGLQFATLFTDGLYQKLGLHGIKCAHLMKKVLTDNGIDLYLENPTNQVCCVLENAFMEKLSEKATFSFMDTLDETHTVVRFCTSWATKEEDINKLDTILKELRG